jgi:hypothetical protein
MAPHQKKAHRLSAYLVFLDESGVLMAPLLRRTWSRCGHTPVLRQRTRSHQKISLIATLAVNPMRTRAQLCFRLHPNRNLTGSEIIAFLRCLLRHVPGHIVLLWDRFNPHRSVATSAFLRTTPRLHVEFFPPYAPELNPTEYFWSYLKNNPLANLALLDLPSLTAKTRSSGRSIQRSQVLLRSFVQHAPLPLRLG